MAAPCPGCVFDDWKGQTVADVGLDSMCIRRKTAFYTLPKPSEGVNKYTDCGTLGILGFNDEK